MIVLDLRTAAQLNAVALALAAATDNVDFLKSATDARERWTEGTFLLANLRDASKAADDLMEGLLAEMKRGLA